MTRGTAVQVGLLSFLWGVSYLLIAAALTGFAPPVVVAGRCALAALFLVPLALRTGALAHLRGRTPLLLLTVLVQSTAPLMLLTYGQEIVAPGLAGIITGAQPLFVAVLAYRFDRGERPRGALGVGGLAMGFAGLLLVFGVDLREIPAGLVGGLLIVAAALCYAVGSILIHRHFAQTPPLAVAGSATAVSAVVLAVPAAVNLPDAMPSVGAVAALVVLGTLCTALSTTLFYRLVAKAGPAQATLSFYLAPGVAVLLSALLVRQPLSWTTVAGLVAIVAGSALAAQRQPVRGSRRL